jgi:predicted signal transduction protein with EAL and GGDEF domain
LRQFGGAVELVARLGGAEFAAVVCYQPDQDCAARIAAKVVRSLGAPYAVNGVTVEIGATVGIARAPVDGNTPTRLLRAADIAMYDAKAAGRGRYSFFHADMDVRLRERAELEREIRAAIRSGAITAYFQPVVSLADDAITGFEALARWDHPTRGLLGPDMFIPIAEDMGVIDELSYAILTEGCRAALDWPEHVTLAVNISPVQLRSPWL